MKRTWKLKSYIYDKVRKTFWKDYDSNEDFVCGTCCKPVFRRYLFCSTECSEIFDYQCHQLSWRREGVLKMCIKAIEERIKQCAESADYTNNWSAGFRCGQHDSLVSIKEFLDKEPQQPI